MVVFNPVLKFISLKHSKNSRKEWLKWALNLQIHKVS